MIDLEELKKLPNEEKLRIIDELEASLEGEEVDDFDPELTAEMEQRYAHIPSGKSKSYTWEEAMAIWKKTAKHTSS